MKFSLVLLAIVLFAFVVSTETRKVGRNIKGHSSSSSSSDDDPYSNWKKADWIAYGRRQQRIAARAERQRQQVLKLYNNIIYPTSSYIAFEIERNNYTVVQDLMIENVTGRINPLGRFDSFFLTGEYFYSLAGPLPGQSTTGRSRVTNLWWTLPVSCANNSCWLRVDIGFSRFSDNVNTQNYTHVSVFNFDSTDRVCSYEANFIGIERQVNLPENNTIRQGAYLSLCNGIIASCTGANTQYGGSVSDCLAFMNSIPYAGWGSADQNTVACRQLHAALMRGNPAVHCPHVGETGGGMCVYHPPSSYFEDGINNCRDKNE